MNTKYTALALSFLFDLTFVVTTANAEMYKCKTPRGIEYQQIPCSAASEAKEIQGNVVVLPGMVTQERDLDKNRPSYQKSRETKSNDSNLDTSKQAQNISPNNLSNLIGDSLTISIKSKGECAHALAGSGQEWESSEDKEILALPECQEKITKNIFEERIFDGLKKLPLAKLQGLNSLQGFVRDNLNKNYQKQESFDYDLYRVLINDYGVKIKEEGKDVVFTRRCFDDMVRNATTVIGKMIYYQILKQNTFADAEVIKYGSKEDHLRRAAKEIKEAIDSIEKSTYCRDYFPNNPQKTKQFLSDLGEFFTSFPQKLVTYKNEEKQAEAINQTEIAEQKAEANEQEAAKEKEYVDTVKSGKKPIESISDAVIFYDADQNYLYFIKNLPLSATGKNYYVNGSIKYLKDGVLICDAGSNDYFGLKPSSKTKGVAVGDLKLNGRLSAVGTHVGNIEYTTRGGEQKMLPLFEALYISP